jgi:hypothetical protein
MRTIPPCLIYKGWTAALQGPPFFRMGFRSLTLLVLLTPVFAGVQELWWNLTYVENVNPDGLFERRVVGVNGTWPWVDLSMF